MTIFAKHPDVGRIQYDENFWTGKKSLLINGEPLRKLDKFTYVLESENKSVTLKGNFIVGVSIKVDNITITLSEKPKWYEMTLSMLILIINLVWGNNLLLLSIVPIVSGAIGGCICGGMIVACIAAMRNTDKVWLKILIGIGFNLASFFICFLLALLILF